MLSDDTRVSSVCSSVFFGDAEAASEGIWVEGIGIRGLLGSILGRRTAFEGTRASSEGMKVVSGDKCSLVLA